MIDNKMLFEIILMILSMINIIIISILVYKKKYAIAWVLAFIQALLIGGYSFVK